MSSIAHESGHLLPWICSGNLTSFLVLPGESHFLQREVLSRTKNSPVATAFLVPQTEASGQPQRPQQGGRWRAFSITGPIDGKAAAVPTWGQAALTLHLHCVCSVEENHSRTGLSPGKHPFTPHPCAGENTAGWFPNPPAFTECSGKYCLKSFPHIRLSFQQPCEDTLILQTRKLRHRGSMTCSSLHS